MNPRDHALYDVSVFIAERYVEHMKDALALWLDTDKTIDRDRFLVDYTGTLETCAQEVLELDRWRDVFEAPEGVHDEEYGAAVVAELSRLAGV